MMIQGNARRIPLADESVDLIVSSPPYFGQRDYKDGGESAAGQVGAEPSPQEFLEALWACTAEWWRVLKPEGSAFINLGDKRSGSGSPGTTSGLGAPNGTKGGLRNNVMRGMARPQGQRTGITSAYPTEAFGRKKSKQLLPHRYAIGCEDGAADPEGIGWIVRQDLVWHKRNGLPESVKDRTLDRHEYVFQLEREGRYYADIDEIREPHAEGTAERYAQGYGDRSSFNEARLSTGYDLGGDDWTPNPRGVVPGSVWSLATEPLVVPDWLELEEHTAPFPSELPRRLILAFCPPSGVVLDPFGGSGTTAMVARALGRTGISLDLSYDYCRLARWRIYESGHGASVVERTNRSRQGTLL